MVIFRPVRLDDLDAVTELAGRGDVSLTTLPHDPKILRKRIDKSARSFKLIPEEPEGEFYFFVLEDLNTSRIVGCSGIVSKVGGYEPFYAYQVKKVVHESRTLKVRKEIQVLHLVAEHNGPCEIGTLFLSPEYRKAGLGRFLSKSRFLFMAEHPFAFTPTVIAEMRGVSDDRGSPPFWEALGRHFFDLNFSEADYLSVLDKRFIAELMPSHPIYISLFPNKVQGLIGQVHERTKPALKILQEEGFEFQGMVDIFDAGPIVTCPLEKIHILKKSRKAWIDRISDDAMAPETFIIASTLKDFRACLGPVQVGSEEVIRINRETASALNLAVNDPVRYAPLYASPPKM